MDPTSTFSLYSKYETPDRAIPNGYESPKIVILEIKVESGFAASGNNFGNGGFYDGL